MRHVTAREANQHFAKVLSAVEGGEEVVISKRGKPVAVMSPYKPAQDEEREAAVVEFLKLLNQPLIPAEGFRTYSRDEMHERP
jgi:prevent-host-death family protein